MPIVNENDTLSTKEIQIGDNDTLGAIAAAMTGASYLFLLTDVDGLYASDPRRDARAPRIDLVTGPVGPLRDRIGASPAGGLGAGSAGGTGGMATKLRAAEIASAAGVLTVIASSSRPSVVAEILAYYTEDRIRRIASVASGSSAADAAGGAPDRGEEARPMHTLFFPSTGRSSLRAPPGFGVLPICI